MLRDQMQPLEKQVSDDNISLPLAEDGALEVAAQNVDEAKVPISKQTTDSLQEDGIEYRYLTFESDMPSGPMLPPNTKVQLPPCPDLTAYENPFNWSLKRKKFMTYLSCSVNITAAYAAGSYASPTAQLTEKWGISAVVYRIGITIFTVGFGVAPMLLAPFSE